MSEVSNGDGQISIESTDMSSGEAKIASLFKALIKLGGSDLHLKAGAKPRIRLQGSLKALAMDPLTDEQILEMMFAIMSPAHKEHFKVNGASDFAYDLHGQDRFRINVFRQRGVTSVAARRVTRTIPTPEQLHLPPHMLKIADARQGLILLSGITGSGKSTTIAAMIEYINMGRACHIVTLEDPIEYLFEDRKSFINQREIGIDVNNFHDGIKYLMREDPDVVLIGEMRDKETFSAALQAAETGHLVFGTVHASTTAQTISRLLDMFPAEERALIRQSLVFNLRAIVTQKLLPSILEGVSRVPAVEILLTNPMVKKLIEDSRETEITSILRSSYRDGMQDFTESLRQLVDKEWIEVEVAYEVAPNPEELKMRLRGISTGGGGILG
ncbi:MAG: PilT/PilU family type 4a pilus ATPase [Phycisphaerae bacterium]|jgi:twitching motility protein PilT|nr:PilT/PilU family type 4a pilus ATPase [Phycisphaerae bacterium]